MQQYFTGGGGHWPSGNPLLVVHHAFEELRCLLTLSSSSRCSSFAPPSSCGSFWQKTPKRDHFSLLLVCRIRSKPTSTRLYRCSVWFCFIYSDNPCTHTLTHTPKEPWVSPRSFHTIRFSPCFWYSCTAKMSFYRSALSSHKPEHTAQSLTRPYFMSFSINSLPLSGGGF